ncbi:MAG: Ig domain-containing protein, partial [Bacteroidaceae bacterium]|nr:Ig domain-containing protein [Bacteroidaceae bacterium]
MVTGISLDKTSLTFTAANQTATLTATVLPSNATNKSVMWTSSNTSVATVDANGKVTAVANGTATITAKTNDGSNLIATCKVTVDIPEPGVFSNNKLYTLTCKRGGLVMNAEGTGLAAGQTRTDAPEVDKHFAIITYNGQYYLYSPTVKQYLLADGSFVSRLGSPITFDDSKADGEYKFMLSTQGTDGVTWYFNNNGDIVICDWSLPDDGNRWLIEPVADFDP